VGEFYEVQCKKNPDIFRTDLNTFRHMVGNFVKCSLSEISFVTEAFVFILVACGCLNMTSIANTLLTSITFLDVIHRLVFI
jgi:hypothetical protein